MAGPDGAFTFKNAVKELAHLSGYLATFMSKPFADSAGSGCHTHVSLLDRGERREPLRGRDDADGISDLCRQFVAGQLRHARSIYALLAPTVNCMKRRRTHTFSPTNVSWGLEDRSALVRIKGGSVAVAPRREPRADRPLEPVPGGRSRARRRAAGDRGAARARTAGSGARPRRIRSKPPLPASVRESLEALEADEKIVALLGDEFVQAYTASCAGTSSSASTTT